MTRELSPATILSACFMLRMAQAQSTFGDRRGTTRDPAGLLQPQAAVNVHSLEENTDRKAGSGGDGSFAIENLKPGHYQLTATKEGFKSSSAVDVELSALSHVLLISHTNW
jgi:hypothetical protein